MKPDAQLSVQDLTCQRAQQVLFTSLNFSLGAAEVLLVNGANGTGKSSLLRILAGLMAPSNGEVYWYKTSITNCTTEYRAQLAYLGHKNGIKLGLTVLENLRLLNMQQTRANKTQLDNLIQQFALKSYLNTLCAQLSQGQRQRLALIKLLLQSAKLWILDEPFTAMDTMGIQIVENYFMEHVRQGGMLVLTSHQSVNLSGLTVQELKLGV